MEAEDEDFGRSGLGAESGERRRRVTSAAAKERLAAEGLLGWPADSRGGGLIRRFYKGTPPCGGVTRSLFYGLKCSGPAFGRALERLWGGD